MDEPAARVGRAVLHTAPASDADRSTASVVRSPAGHDDSPASTDVLACGADDGGAEGDQYPLGAAVQQLDRRSSFDVVERASVFF